MDNMIMKEKIEELRKKIKHYNKKYYDENISEIPDYEYDKLMVELRDLENQHPQYASDDSPTKRVGGYIRRELRRVEHDVPMISLENVFSKEEVFSFVNKMRIQLIDPLFIVEKKIDGLSVVLRYEHGHLVEGITRGDGITGESIYENLLVISSVPRDIPEKHPYLEVRGEVYMSNQAFEKVNERQELQGQKLYQNARNLASGTMRQLDPAIVKERNLDIFIFNLEIIEGKTFQTHSDSLRWLESQGFPVIPDYMECKTADEIWEAVKKIGESRGRLDYSIDGAVVKIDNLSEREKLGSTSKVPRWAVAYKYPPEEKQTIIEDIQIQVGRTGRLTPLAVLKPVRLAGTTVSKATLHNQDNIDLKDIRIGDTVIVRKAGDIIPEILKSVRKNRSKDSEPFKIPLTCPVCGSEAKKEGNLSEIRCINLNCPAQVTRLIIHFASKDAMDIDGLGPANVDALMSNGYIKDVGDIFFLKNYREELIEKGIVGKAKGTDNLLSAIEESKNNDIDRLLTGFGIRNIGKQIAKVLALNFADINAIIKASYEELKELPYFGDINSRSIIDYFSKEETRDLLKKLETAGVNMTSKALETIKANIFEGKTFVLTGTLKTMKRKDASELIESYGGKTSSSVSKNTSYLLAGQDAGSKLRKAQELDIPVIDEDELLNMIKNK